jgi:hypothetical protein
VASTPGNAEERRLEFQTTTKKRKSSRVQGNPSVGMSTAKLEKS